VVPQKQAGLASNNRAMCEAYALTRLGIFKKAVIARSRGSDRDREAPGRARYWPHDAGGSCGAVTVLIHADFSGHIDFMRRISAPEVDSRPARASKPFLGIDKGQRLPRA